MPDISMCNNKECSFRETCYRFKAKPSYYQSYSDFTEFEPEGDKCHYYWPLEPDETITDE